MIAMPQPHVTQITLQLKPFVCLICGNTLGDTDGLRLYACNCLIVSKTQLQCIHCGTLRVWRPVGIALSQLTDAREQVDRGS